MAKGQNKSNWQLGTANLIDALVAVLTLQNTMIIASAGEITQLSLGHKKAITQKAV